ncbi:MAG: T9SS type A sorting domain-containing protein [Crocinitomicaceae bacterium]|nr:T9SS type A sorting domain-containing protein [Crocinitomicaceae bacterium]
MILTNEETSEGSTIQSLTMNESSLNRIPMTITQMGNSFNVEVAENLNEDSQIKLVNVLGQTEVYSSTIRFVQGSNIITVPAELKGVHILIITTGDKIVTKKVVL